MAFDYDLLVIGGGSGGVRCARIASGHGAKVAIVEEFRWGGTCVIRGCVPKKLMVYASEVASQLAIAKGFGWDIERATFNWQRFIAAKDSEITRLSGIYDNLLKNAGVTTLQGSAQLVDAHTVRVSDKGTSTSSTNTAAHIVVATGGTPVWPDGVPRSPASADSLHFGPGNGANERTLAARPTGWVSSNEAFHLPTRPNHIAIYGSGYIAIEFAHIFKGMGADVSLIYRSDLPLRGFDQDVRVAVRDGLALAGIFCHPSAKVVANHEAGAGRLLTLDNGTTINVDCAMAAIGRVANTATLGLHNAGVVLSKTGGVVVDQFSRTNIPSIYAIGDVTERANLTPVAIREGHALADTLFGHRPTAVDHRMIPSAVFSQPPVGVVGETEQSANAKGIDVATFKTTFRPMRHTLGGSDGKILMKLVVDKSNRKVLGAHMVGADSPEIIQMAAIAITMGATKDDFDRTIAIHPTAAEEFVLMRG